MKIAGEKPATPIPNEPSPDSESGFGEDLPDAESSNDKPFDDEPFDAGVEADEQSDPKKFIEQLTGKLGQSLRKYNEDHGQPDLELEKFAINSILSATHTSEMDSEDQNDIIKKVKEAGNNDHDDDNKGDENDSDENDSDDSLGDLDDLGGDLDDETSGEIDDINETEDLFLENPKKNNMFQPNSNDILKTPVKENSDKNLNGVKKNSIFDKIKAKLHETFNQDDDMTNTETEPAVKPAPSKPNTIPNEPSIAPSRKNKPFLPMPEVQPDPKAKNGGGSTI